jgi:hypothetical protein
MAPKLQKQCKQKVAAAETVRNKPAAAQNVQKTVRKKPAAAQTAQQAQGQVLTPLGREWDSLVAVDQAIKDAKHELAWLDVCIRGALRHLCALVYVSCTGRRRRGALGQGGL